MQVIAVNGNSALLAQSMMTFEGAAPLVKEMRPRAARTLRLFEKAKIYGGFSRGYFATSEERAQAILDRVPLASELYAEAGYCENSIISEAHEGEIAKAVSWLAKVMPFGVSSMNEYSVEAFTDAVCFPRPENGGRGFSLPVVMCAVRAIIDRDKAMPPVSRMVEACGEARVKMFRHRDAALWLTELREKAEDEIGVFDGTIPTDDETIPF